MLFRGTFATQRPGGAANNAMDVYVKNTSNTNVVHWGVRLWTLFEAGQPYRLDPATLETEVRRLGSATADPVDYPCCMVSAAACALCLAYSGLQHAGCPCLCRAWRRWAVRCSRACHLTWVHKQPTRGSQAWCAAYTSGWAARHTCHLSCSMLVRKQGCGRQGRRSCASALLYVVSQVCSCSCGLLSTSPCSCAHCVCRWRCGDSSSARGSQYWPARDVFLQVRGCLQHWGEWPWPGHWLAAAVPLVPHISSSTLPKLLMCPSRHASSLCALQGGPQAAAAAALAGHRAHIHGAGSGCGRRMEWRAVCVLHVSCALQLRSRLADVRPGHRPALHTCTVRHPPCCWCRLHLGSQAHLPPVRICLPARLCWCAPLPLTP